MKTIYVLIDPVSMTTVYIGSSKRVKGRYSQHIAPSILALEHSRKADWLRSLREKHYVPLLREIETVPDKEALEREELWIKYYVEMGLDVVNKAYNS